MLNNCSRYWISRSFLCRLSRWRAIKRRIVLARMSPASVTTAAMVNRWSRFMLALTTLCGTSPSTIHPSVPTG